MIVNDILFTIPKADYREYRILNVLRNNFHKTFNIGLGRIFANPSR